jgi:Raf kinase inhibitor-like YbhB/YbcL family protein
MFMSSRPDSIDLETAGEYLTEGRAQFIDARPRDEYQRSGRTIPDAVHIDPGSGAEVDERLSQLPRERLIIAYCDEPNQAASAQIARRARELTLGDASVLEGGFRAWCAAGLPTVENPDARRPPRAAQSASQPTASATAATMRLHSAALRPGDPIPVVHTLYGENLSPPLAWEQVPPGTRSLMLLMEDRDASGRGGQPFTHWILYNLQPSSAGLDLGASWDGLPAGCAQGLNDFGQRSYGGPRPPYGRHRYVLRLYALDTTLDPAALDRADRSQVLASASGHVLAEAELEATYEHSAEVQPRV